MTASPLSKPRIKKLLIIIASPLIIIGAALGTTMLLKHIAPIKMTDTNKETATESTASLKKAEQLFSEGDYEGAKAQYKAVIDTYKSQGNETDAADAEMQLKVLEATANAPAFPQNTNKEKVSAGSPQTQ